MCLYFCHRLSNGILEGKTNRVLVIWGEDSPQITKLFYVPSQKSTYHYILGSLQKPMPKWPCEKHSDISLWLKGQHILCLFCAFITRAIGYKFSICTAVQSHMYFDETVGFILALVRTLRICRGGSVIVFTAPVEHLGSRPHMHMAGYFIF